MCLFNTFIPLHSNIHRFHNSLITFRKLMRSKGEEYKKRKDSPRNALHIFH